MSLSFLNHNLTTLDLLLFGITAIFVTFIYQKLRQLQRLLPFNPHKKPSKILSVVAGENIDMTQIEQSLYTTDLTYNLLPYSSVSQDSVLSELNKGFNVFELSSHGLNGKFALGNTTLPITWLAEALKEYPLLDVVLLLYCKSAQDIAIIAQLGKFVIGLTDEVKDTDCITFARQFYYYLNKQYDYKEAFDHAKLHLPVDVYPKFIFNDGRLTKWPILTYQRITNVL